MKVFLCLTQLCMQFQLLLKTNTLKYKDVFLLKHSNVVSILLDYQHFNIYQQNRPCGFFIFYTRSTQLLLYPYC